MGLSCDAKLYNGKCPKIYSNVTIDCKTTAFFNELKVVGFLSSSSDTLNFFHNEFESIKCISINLNCIKHDKYLLSFSFGCKSSDSLKHCYPILLNSVTKLNEHRLSFDFTKDTFCPEEIIKRDIQFLYNDELKYLIIYGCYESDRHMSDHGLWIFASDEMMQKTTAKEFKEHAAKILNEINPDLMTDLLFFDDDEEDCKCNTCDYFMRCHITKLLKKDSKSSGNKAKASILFLFVICIKVTLMMFIQ